MAIQRDKVIANAEKLVAKGKVEPAIKEYERLLEDNPNDVNTLNRIGDLWVRINRNDEACKVFGKIADHYSKDGFFLKAIAIYKKINKLDPSKLDVYAKLADLYAKQGLAMEAKSQYQVLADYYLKHGDSANALQIYRKIAELDPNSINVHVKLADLHSQTGQTAEALKEYDRVGRMLLKRGMLDEAVQVFRKALKIDARNIELVESLVNALFDAKDYNNAQQIVELALDANRDNPRLTAMWARILLAKGDVNSARSALERGLNANPTDASMRESLSELYAKENNPDKALEMVAPLVEKSLARGERTAAVEMLNRINRAAPSHAPTLERLVAVYERLNEETNIVTALNGLAEAYIAQKKYDHAGKALERLIEREPQNAQHRNKLQFVRQQMGVSSAPPAAPPAPPAAPPPKPAVSLEIEEPVPTFDMEEPEPASAISLDFDASPPIELDLGGPAPVAPPPIEPEREISVGVDEEEEDLDFVTEHLTEAEVFAKYGLAEKAAEHLRAVLERSPKNTTAHERLYRLLLDEGNVADARAVARNYLGILQDKGDMEAIDAVHNEFLSRGQTFDAPAAKPAAPRPATVEKPKPKTLERPKPKTLERPAPPAAEPEALLATEIAASEEISIDLDSGGVNFDVDAINLDDAMPPAAAEPLAFEEPLALEPEPEPEPVEEAIDFGPPAEEEPMFAAEPPPAIGEEPTVEELGEIDFYIEQELYDEAAQKIESLLASYPDHPELLERQERIEALTAAPPPPPPPPRPAVLSRDEIESELLAAIPDDDEMSIPAPPAPAFEPPPPPPPVAAAHEENLFADEDNFFDLASELEAELVEDEESVPLAEEEQSLEQIFKEFKKGVEQQLDSEDYDTHYNLGIAYKEMGLIDEAIGEFQLASKDPKRAVECASMLGLCFLEKGMPQLAIKWYRKGLEMPELTEEEHIGLLYDLGSAYVEVGDTSNAQKAFMEVYGMNTNYRDVISRIKQLEATR